MSASATAAVTEPVKKDSVPEIIAASMVGTAIEFYDNYCYSIAAASYFGAIFFANVGLRVKMCVWLGVSRGLDLAFLNAD